MFQSTPPHGERLFEGYPVVKVVVVSIHAPAWGATAGNGHKKLGEVGFNPRPRMGSDSTGIRSRLAVICFNPRPRMGSDADRVVHWPAALRFQSTPPHGERLSRYCIFLVTSNVSIHAPAWGATRIDGLPDISPESFNPRPRMGSDSITKLSKLRYNRFNPRPRMGSDVCDIIFSVYII